MVTASPINSVPLPTVWQDRLPAIFRRHGTSLIQQQFWLWGQDIKRPCGNLLLARGFSKERPPEGVAGSSTYTLDLGPGQTITLWGFGLFVGSRSVGGLYVGRFRLAPLLVDQSMSPRRVWEPRQLPVRRRPEDDSSWARARWLLEMALRWVGEYERWVLETQGAAYRADCLAAWPRAVSSPRELATQWFHLAEQASTIRR
jgi:hypothetical protein